MQILSFLEYSKNKFNLTKILFRIYSCEQLLKIKEESLGYLPILFLKIPTIGFEFDSDFSYQKTQEGGG
jgi:hypothetical protein